MDIGPRSWEKSRFWLAWNSLKQGLFSVSFFGFLPKFDLVFLLSPKPSFFYKIKTSPSISCVLAKCKFPQTCQWNRKCMEEGLRLSLASKKIDGAGQKEGTEEKTQKKVRRKPTG